MTYQVGIINESSLSTDDAWQLAWALDYQARYQFGRAWNIPARVNLLPPGVTPKVNQLHLIIHLLDTSDQQGALGYHDEDGNEIPFAKVFVKDSEAGGTSASAVASHEMTEMLVDLHVNLLALDPKSNRVYAYEVGDPVQGNDYDVGAPEGRTTGIKVSDFALADWFDTNTPADHPTSFRGSVKGPFAIAPQGYMSFLDLNNPSQGFQSVWGSERKVPPPTDNDDHYWKRDVVRAPVEAGPAGGSPQGQTGPSGQTA